MQRPDDTLFLEHPRATERFLAGLCLFLGAAGVALVTLGVRAAAEGVYSAEERVRIPLLAVAACAAVFGPMALALLTLRRAVHVDLDGREVAVRWTCLGLRGGRALPLDGRGAVVLRAATAVAAEHAVHFFRLEYVHPDGALELHRVRSLDEGQRWQAEFAEHLDS